MEEIIARIPPNDIQAEQAVLRTYARRQRCGAHSNRNLKAR